MFELTVRLVSPLPLFTVCTSPLCVCVMRCVLRVCIAFSFLPSDQKSAFPLAQRCQRYIYLCACWRKRTPKPWLMQVNAVILCFIIKHHRYRTGSSPFPGGLDATIQSAEVIECEALLPCGAKDEKNDEEEGSAGSRCISAATRPFNARRTRRVRTPALCASIAAACLPAVHSLHSTRTPRTPTRGHVFSNPVPHRLLVISQLTQVSGSFSGHWSSSGPGVMTNVCLFAMRKRCERRDCVREEKRVCSRLLILFPVPFDRAA